MKNREILFRGYYEGNPVMDNEYFRFPKWVYGALIQDLEKNKTWILEIIKTDGDEIIYKKYSVHPDSVGQFTGLKDIKKQKEFEGSIWGCEIGAGYFTKYCNDCLGFRPHYIGVTMKGKKSVCCAICDGQMDIKEWLGDVWDCTYKIIGNVFENPELLEG